MLDGVEGTNENPDDVDDEFDIGGSAVDIPENKFVAAAVGILTGAGAGAGGTNEGSTGVETIGFTVGTDVLLMVFVPTGRPLELVTLDN